MAGLSFASSYSIEVVWRGASSGEIEEPLEIECCVICRWFDGKCHQGFKVEVDDAQSLDLFRITS